VSEFLDRLLVDVRERLAASRAAVREYERLERALAALDGVGDGAARTGSAARRSRGSAGVQRPRTRPERSARPGVNRDRLLALVGERPGVTREELQGVTGLSAAVVAQNLRRMVRRAELREQELPGGQTGYTTSAIDPGAARASNGDAGVSAGGQGRAGSDTSVESP
jgi:hypothetical protein